MNLSGYIKHKINGGIKRFILFFYKDAFPLVNNETLKDLETKALFPYCKGVGIDVGCGSRKIHPSAIGIDLTPKGKTGKFGSERRQISKADICLSGDNLYIFANNVFDFVVSKHNLEHYQDPIKALKEWKRVLKINGILGIVVPDDQNIDTIKLDPTHKHVYTVESFKNIIEVVGGFKILKIKPCVKNWSFVCIAKKI